MKKYFWITALLITFHLKSLCQVSEGWKIDSLKIDSMKRRLPLLRDTAHINCMNAISKKYQTSNDYLHWIDSIYRYSSQAYNDASKIGYKYGIATSLLSLAYYELDRNNDSLAENYFQQTMVIGETLLDPDAIGRAYMYWSEIIIRRRNHDSNASEISRDNNALIDTYKKAIGYFKNAGNGMGEGEACTWLGMTYTQLGKNEEAFEFCEKGLELSKINARKTNEYEILQWSLFNMSELYKAAGDYETALDYLRQCRKIVAQQNLDYEMDANMGDLFNLSAQFDSAFYYFLKFKNNPNRNSWSHLYYAGSLVGLAETYFNTKQYDSALSILMECISTFRKESKIRNRNTGLIKPLILTGKVYSEKKNYTTALEYEKEGLSLAKRYGEVPMLIDANEALGTIYHLTGKDDSAYFYLKTYISLKDSLLTKQYLWRLNNKLNSFQRSVEESKKKTEIQLLNKDNKLKTQQLKQQAQQKNFLILGLVGLFFIGFFIFRWLTLKRKNEKLNNEKVQTELQQRTVELEMQALRAQMNPHFIFNCLSSINRFILKNEGKTASSYLVRFSRLIRMVLINSQKPLITLEDELQMLTIYLDMERLRFKDSFDYGITFLNTVETGNIFIPPLLLQPFCENAIWHGLMHKEGQGRLNIEFSLKDNILHCTIADNGIGLEKSEEMKSKSAEKEKSMGLKITTERLALLNREKGLKSFFDIENILDEKGNVAGTKINLKIGFKEKEELINT